MMYQHTWLRFGHKRSNGLEVFNPYDLDLADSNLDFLPISIYLYISIYIIYPHVCNLIGQLSEVYVKL